MNSSYIALIQSDRVSKRTTEVLLERAQPLDPKYQPKMELGANFATLRAIVELLIPNDLGGLVEIASRLAEQRSSGTGDGWRYASMPPDAKALGQGLDLVEASANSSYGTSFLLLNREQKSALLAKVQKGEVAWPQLDAKRWFEDLLAEATEIYISHPSTLAELGFSGIAFLPRWPEVGLDTAQPWEPISITDKKSQP